MTWAIVFCAFLAFVGLSNWLLRRPCKKCGKRMCEEPEMIGLTHSMTQCERDSCWCPENRWFRKKD